MSQQGLRINTSGILKIVRYLWSLPVVRQMAGWLLQVTIEKIIEALRKKRPPKPKPDGGAAR